MELVKELFKDKLLGDDRPPTASFDVADYHVEFRATNLLHSAQILFVSAIFFNSVVKMVKCLVSLSQGNGTGYTKYTHGLLLQQIKPHSYSTI